MFPIIGAPEWAQYYIFLMHIFDFRFEFNKRNLKHIPNYDGLMRIHYYCMMDNAFDEDFYNTETYRTMNNNFFHCFVKFISLCEKYRNMDDYILFLSNLLNREEVCADLHSLNYENEDAYECYMGHKYKTHLEFIIDYNCDNLITLQRKYRKHLHRKKLRRCLNMIKLSPPRQVEFYTFKSFPGGVDFFTAFDSFYSHAS